MNKGQIQLTFATGLAVVSFVAAPIVAFFSAQAASDAKISSLETRTAVVENSVQNTNMNLQEIKDDLKDIKKYLNIK